MKKSQQLNIRLSPELAEQLEEACAMTGLEATALVRECLKAFIEEVRENGEIRLPLALVPKRSLEQLKAAAEESPKLRKSA